VNIHLRTHHNTPTVIKIIKQIESQILEIWVA
jgi:hypothetical protein